MDTIAINMRVAGHTPSGGRVTAVALYPILADEQNQQLWGDTAVGGSLTLMLPEKIAETLPVESRVTLTLEHTQSPGLVSKDDPTAGMTAPVAQGQGPGSPTARESRAPRGGPAVQNPANATVAATPSVAVGRTST